MRRVLRDHMHRPHRAIITADRPPAALAHPIPHDRAEASAEVAAVSAAASAVAVAAGLAEDAPAASAAVVAAASAAAGAEASAADDKNAKIEKEKENGLAVLFFQLSMCLPRKPAMVWASLYSVSPTFVSPSVPTKSTSPSASPSEMIGAAMVAQ